jgi:hypothetical protein
MMRRSLLPALLVVSITVLAPATVRAQQASITGVVRDTSGAVLPGVTVEATSPALIEKGRSSPTVPASTASSTCVPATTP